MFCRNCGKGLDGTPEICANCGSHPVKATAFCRYCGNATNAQDLMCPTCGAAIKKIAEPAKKAPRHPVLTVLNILAIALVVSLYIWLSLPPKVAKPIKAAASDAMLAATGYTSLPLHSISAAPPVIPPQRSVENFYMPVGLNINGTQQLTIYAVYKNTTGANATKATRLEEVTADSTYKSSNEKIATVNATGFVRAVALGAANITVSYTAAPGSANLSAAAEGKAPITVTVIVPVLVTGPPVGAAPTAPAPGT